MNTGTAGATPRRIVILGATGSIGRSTADVIARSPAGMFEVDAVAGGRDAVALARTARALGAKFAAICDETRYSELKAELSGSGIEAAAGANSVVEAARRPADMVVAAIAGAAGVAPTHAAAMEGRVIALANKECLVCAGPPFMRDAERRGARLLPLDSEHNAIFQALGERDVASIEKMTLTASGGPFRCWTREQIDAATPEQALAHPNWSMGAKITVDSAGLMNKGLELIEASYLFGIEAARLDVLVHPQSIVHGLVSFADGTMIAGLSNPDMRVHVAHCLAYPERVATAVPRLDLAAIGALTFEKPDFARFPALRIALDALAAGGAMPTVLNAANEAAVEAFLARRISFADIAVIVAKACEEAARRGEDRAPDTIEDAMAVDHVVRERVAAILAERSRSGMVIK